MHPILAMFAPILTVFTTHYVSSQAYTYICTPFSIEGFVQSMITTASSLCTNLLTIMIHTSNAYGTAIATGISWVIMNILTQKPAISEPT